MRAKDFIIEYSQAETMKNYGMKAFLHWEKEQKQNFSTKNAPESPEIQTWVKFVVDRLENVDPTPHKEYVQWIVKTYGNNPNEKTEDWQSRGKDALEKFNTLKIRKILPADKRDINRLRSLRDLEDLVAQYVIPGAEEAAKGKAQEFYNDAQLRIVVPLDMQAAIYYGQNTRWCTAAKNDNRFDSYNKEGSLYIILPKQPSYVGEKYQLHFADGQYMNIQDEPVKLNELKDRFPQLPQIFDVPATEVMCFPLMANGAQVLRDWDSIINVTSHVMIKSSPLLANRVIKIIRNEFMQRVVEDPEGMDSIIDGLQLDLTDSRNSIIHAVLESIRIAYENGADVEQTIEDGIGNWVSDSGTSAAIFSMEEADESFDSYDITMSIIHEINEIFVPVIKQTVAQILKQNY